MSEYDAIQETAAAIAVKWPATPGVGIILGTGLGGLAGEIENPVYFPYEALPHFPRSTAPSHHGRLVAGTLSGKNVIAMQGRFHIYEGYRAKQIAYPVRVMKALGCHTMIVSNAGGGLNPQYDKGDLMLIEDHINLLGDNPLIGVNDDRLGVRFPDMCHAYDRDLLKLAKAVALEEKLSVQQGVYVAVAGPNLETAAEYRFLRTIGADIVGMSTVPETIVARHGGMRVLGVSVVTDMCLADALKPVSSEEIVATANAAELKLRVLVKKVVERL